DLKLRGSIEDFVSFREMITSQLQGKLWKLWLYDEAGGEYEDKDEDFEDIRRSPYNDKDTEDIRRYS
ncbi:hypothetical protein Tco_1426211, partial [Tanacetum coccineum]